MSRSFVREKFPDKERKSAIKILLSRPKKDPVRNPLVVSALENCSTYSEALHRLTKNVLDISRSALEQKSGMQHGLLQSSSPGVTGAEAAKRARSLLFEDCIALTDQLFSEGKLSHLEGSSRTEE